MKKRGDLSPGFIAGIVILILSMLVLLFFLVRSNLQEGTADEICQTSILTRATTPDVAQRYVPLKCTTKKVCLTINEDCLQLQNEENVMKVKLDTSRPQESADIIEKYIADSTFDCWKMTGQGKLDLFAVPISKNYFENVENYLNLNDPKSSCIICSRLAISEELQNEKSILQLIDVNDYMANTPVPGSSQTYLETLTDRQVNAIPGEVIDRYSDERENKSGTDQIAIIFAQVKSEETWKEGAITGALHGAGFVFGSSYALGLTGKIVTTLPGFLVAATAIAGTAGIKAWNADNHQDFSVGYCGEFTSSETNKYGCSIVTQADWNNKTAINNLCGRIEGRI